jgi:hypothetical protein
METSSCGRDDSLRGEGSGKLAESWKKEKRRLSFNISIIDQQIHGT